MIEVCATEGGGKYRLWIEGHAQSGAERDAVCAGVSALVQSLVLYAAQTATQRRLRYQLSPGQAFFSCRDVGEGFALVMGGLAAIAREYPRHLRINSFLSVDDKSEQT